MLNSKSFLAVDFGAGTLKLAEFEPNEAGGLRLKQYAIKALGIEGAQEAAREKTILNALNELLTQKNFGAKQINVCAPGFHVFSKFVKLPPVDTSKVTQIIQYEAQQNVPFPLEEVVWDYQILGTTATSELEVLLVAIKSDIVDGLFRVAEGAGLRIKLVDVSPAALCNAFRYNYGDLEDCSMLLDIGAKTSNLLFFEKGKVYARSINIGANSITQDFANEVKVKFNDADGIKIEKGFVSLGGAYEEPDDPQAAAISKIARQVMTRLHIQVNQTIQFFRGQQGGSAPKRLFLSGGASVMPYTAQFFAEKLNIPVDYFNPFRNIQIDPNLDTEDLSKFAHSFGEVVGLGLRDLAHCPVELNLMPKSSIQRQEFGQKKPYFIAAVFSLVLVVFAIGFAAKRVGGVRSSKLEEIKAQRDPLVAKDQQLRGAISERDRIKKEAEQLAGLVDNRIYWAEVLNELRRVFQQAEDKTKQAFKSKGIDAEFGVWIESFAPVLPNGSPFAVQAQADAPVGGAAPAPSGARPPEANDMAAFSRRYGLESSPAPANPAAAAPVPGTTTSGGENEISLISIVCRGVDRDKMTNSANFELAYTLKEELKASPLFTDPTLGEIKKDDSASTNTFNFTLSVQLKRPFKL